MISPWKWLCENTTKPVFAAVVFACGVIVWGGFNTAMEATNTLEFCVSCHEMRDNVFAEYQETAHYQNPAGIRAICSDCHVPKDWGHKVVRKIKATNELFHWAMGTIDTPEKFEAKRLDLARTVWAEMRANGSRECLNCHSFDAMHWKKQSLRAMVTMQTAQQKDLSCIECHKGVAHKLPDMYAHYDTLAARIRETVAADDLSGQTVMTAGYKRLRTTKSNEAEKLLDIMPLTSFSVLAREGDWLNVRLVAWTQNGHAELYSQAGRHREIALLSDLGLQRARHGESIDIGGIVWRKATVEGWIHRDQVTSNPKPLLGYVEELWRTECNMCHNLPQPERYTAEEWLKPIALMREQSKLPGLQMTMILKFLQSRAKTPDELK